MKTLCTLLIVLFSLSQTFGQIIYQYLSNAEATSSSPYKLDLDADGVKDIWFEIEEQGNGDYNYYVTGKNGTEVETETATDANRLEAGNQVGNNIWSSRALLAVGDGGSSNITGNFGGSNDIGYIGIRFLKNGNFYNGWVYLWVSYGDIKLFSHAVSLRLGGGILANQIVETIVNTKDFQSGGFSALLNNNQLKIAALSNALPYQYQVFDVSGKAVLSGKANQEETNLPFTPQAGGIYFLQIQDKNQKLFFKKLVGLQ